MILSMSAKPVAEKLLIKKGYSVLVVDEPEGYRDTLGALPEDVKIEVIPGEPVDLVQIFVTDMKDLKEKLPIIKQGLKEDGLIWFSYPKGTSKLARELGVDVNRDTIWRYAEGLGYMAVAMVSIDETWSALRLRPV